MIARLQKKYKEECISSLKEKFKIKNSMSLPRLEKIVVNMGVGRAIGDMKILDGAFADMMTITGQKPVMTRARIAVSNFKLREGMPIGCRVTLRRAKMYEFFDRLVNVALPRIRDFNGVSNKSFDNQGNYSIGIIEQAIFPEIDTSNMPYVQGMDITFVFLNGAKERSRELLHLLGMPFSKR